MALGEFKYISLCTLNYYICVLFQKIKLFSLFHTDWIMRGCRESSRRLSMLFRQEMMTTRTRIGTLDRD